jgi:membrane protease YdiL (CAAX protease family)
VSEVLRKSSGSDAALAPARSRALAAWEIASVASSTLVAEWAVLAAAGFDKLWLAPPVLLAFGLMIYSHRLRGETLRDLGWRFDNFWRALALLLPAMLLGAGLLALVGRFWFGAPLRAGEQRAGWSVFGLPVWGFAWGLLQQLVLQGFVNRRAQLIFGRGAASVLVVASVFALLHLPNPWLTAATFAGGVLWAWAYQRTPNLLALALSHALMTWALVSTLPEHALDGLRVGYKYFG